MSRGLRWAALLVASAHMAFAVAAEDHSAHKAPQSSTDHDAKPEASDPHAQHGTMPADQPTQSELRHIPPDPPQHPMHDMSSKQMIELMAMDDTSAIGTVLLDQFEWREIDRKDAWQWDGEAWYGNDYNKAWFKSEGARTEADYEGRAELLWDRVFARWWNVQAGVRHDFGEGQSRTWAAFGVQGLAPYWFEVEATAYVGSEGRTALRLSAEYELLLTQRLILQPKLEFNLYGKRDPANDIGAGLSDSEFGLRLRYELRREFAPYVGIVWIRNYGATADVAREARRDSNDVQWTAGVRWWF